jgi:hypothetical protein
VFASLASIEDGLGAGVDLTEPLALDHFLECGASGAGPRTDGWNGVRVVATLEAAQQSLEEGGAQVEVQAARPPSG